MSTVHCSCIPCLLVNIHCSRAHFFHLLTVHSCSSQLSLEHNDEMMPDDVRAVKVAQAAQAKAVADRKADMEAKMAATLANPVTAEEKEQVRERIPFIFTFILIQVHLYSLLLTNHGIPRIPR